MMPLNLILRKCIGWDLNLINRRINHLLYIAEIKLFDKSEEELETLIQAMRTYSYDRGME